MLGTLQLPYSFFCLFENELEAINCQGVYLQMNTISVEQITTGLIQGIEANGSERNESKDLNLLAICNIFHLDARATALSKLKLN